MRIHPGDLVEFTFWSTYLAADAFSEHANTRWIELIPGDRGLVVATDPGEDEDGEAIMTVMWSRVDKLLRVRESQLKIVT